MINTILPVEILRDEVFARLYYTERRAQFVCKLWYAHFWPPHVQAYITRERVREECAAGTLYRKESGCSILFDIIRLNLRELFWFKCKKCADMDQTWCTLVPLHALMYSHEWIIYRLQSCAPMWHHVCISTCGGAPPRASNSNLAYNLTSLLLAAVVVISSSSMLAPILQNILCAQYDVHPVVRMLLLIQNNIEPVTGDDTASVVEILRYIYGKSDEVDKHGYHQTAHAINLILNMNRPPSKNIWCCPPGLIPRAVEYNKLHDVSIGYADLTKFGTRARAQADELLPLCEVVGYNFVLYYAIKYCGWETVRALELLARQSVPPNALIAIIDTRGMLTPEYTAALRTRAATCEGVNDIVQDFIALYNQTMSLDRGLLQKLPEFISSLLRA